MAPFPHDDITRRISAFAEHISDATLTPTRSLLQAATRVLPRQETVTVVADEGTSGSNLSGGAIAGIVIGSVAGFLLLLWIIKSCSGNFGAPAAPAGEPYYEEPKRHHSHRRHHHHHHHSRSPYRRTSMEHRTVTPVMVDRPSRSPRRPSPSYYRTASRGRSRGY